MKRAPQSTCTQLTLVLFDFSYFPLFLPGVTATCCAQIVPLLATQSGANESRPGSSIPILRAAILPANFSHMQIRSKWRGNDDETCQIPCAQFIEICGPLRT